MPEQIIPINDTDPKAQNQVGLFVFGLCLWKWMSMYRLGCVYDLKEGVVDCSPEKLDMIYFFVLSLRNFNSGLPPILIALLYFTTICQKKFA